MNFDVPEISEDEANAFNAEITRLVEAGRNAKGIPETIKALEQLLAVFRRLDSLIEKRRG